MDDLKISHKDKALVKQVIQQIEEEYGEMSVTTGSVHSYCYMKLIFKGKQVKIEMIDYLKDTVAEFPENCEVTITNPAAMHLFEVDKNEEK